MDPVAARREGARILEEVEEESLEQVSSQFHIVACDFTEYRMIMRLRCSRVMISSIISHLVLSYRRSHSIQCPSYNIGH